MSRIVRARSATTNALALACAVLLASPAARATPYDAEIARWRTVREERLKAPDGWLTLVGLFWLKPGDNRLPDPIPPAVAPFRLADGRVTHEGRLLRSDAEPGGPDKITSGTFTLYVIRRGERFAVRAKDSAARSRREFAGLDWYPAKPEYRVAARLVRYPHEKLIDVPNVLGGTDREPSPGHVAFTLNGRALELDPTLENGHLFFVFRDGTSGKETYGASRFLDADLPAGSDDTVILDFNKAYNPPCAFTPFATCPMPPPQNRLPVRIEAGERTYKGAPHHD